MNSFRSISLRWLLLSYLRHRQREKQQNLEAQTIKVGVSVSNVGNDDDDGISLN